MFVTPQFALGNKGRSLGFSFSCIIQNDSRYAMLDTYWQC